MNHKTDKTPSGPMINPYVFTLLLLAFGLWCIWDGWLARDTGMADYAVTMNRVAGVLLIVWAAWDFYKLRKKAAASQKDDASSSHGPGKG